MAYPLISVITVCYNAAKALEKTFQSIDRQDYPNIEYIVVDGGSTDDTALLLKKYGSIIDKQVSEKDYGIYDAMNKGVSMATGEWCCFINAGDTFVDNDTISKVFSEKRNADVIYGDVVKYDKNGNANVKKAKSPRNSHRMYFCHQSAFTRTECLRNTPYDIKHRMSADFKLYKQLWKQGCSFLQLDFPISVFDTSGVSNSQRSKGLADNISVIREVDSVADQLRLLPRLYFTYWSAKLRGK